MIDQEDGGLARAGSPPRPVRPRVDRGSIPNHRADLWVLRRLLGGWRPQAVAVAGGVSVRTAYRWLEQVERLEDVQVAGWRATFAMRRGKPPWQVSRWERCP